MMLERFGCYLYWRMGMNRTEICLYIAFTYEAANEWLQERQLVNNKARGAYIRQIG